MAHNGRQHEQLHLARVCGSSALDIYGMAICCFAAESVMVQASGSCLISIPRVSLTGSRMQRGYDGELLGGTFSRAVFVGNGLVAIVAGLVAHSLVETLGLGPVAPFDAAALVMVFGGVIVLFSWTENFGNCSERKSFVEQLKSGAHAIANGEARRSACCVFQAPTTPFWVD